MTAERLLERRTRWCFGGRRRPQPQLCDFDEFGLHKTFRRAAVGFHENRDLVEAWVDTGEPPRGRWTSRTWLALVEPASTASAPADDTAGRLCATTSAGGQPNCDPETTTIEAAGDARRAFAKLFAKGGRYRQQSRTGVVTEAARRSPRPARFGRLEIHAEAERQLESARQESGSPRRRDPGGVGAGLGRAAGCGRHGRVPRPARPRPPAGVDRGPRSVPHFTCRYQRLYARRVPGHRPDPTSGSRCAWRPLPTTPRKNANGPNFVPLLGRLFIVGRPGSRSARLPPRAASPKYLRCRDQVEGADRATLRRRQPPIVGACDPMGQPWLRANFGSEAQPDTQPAYQPLGAHAVRTISQARLGEPRSASASSADLR